MKKIIALLLVISSCSHFKQNGDLNDEALAKVKLSTQNSTNKVSPRSIIGSSVINNKSKHHTKTYFLYGAEQLNLKHNYFDIPVVYNQKVKMWIDYFVNKRGRGFFKRYSERSGRYAPLMGDILESEGLPRDLIFLAMAESGFHNKAKSWAKAVGPWQFMPYTGKRFGLKINWFVDERRDPVKATHAAAAYLKKLYSLFGSWELATASYNAGEGKVNRAIRRYKTKNFWKISKGRYLKSETKNYVPKIMALAIIGKNLKSFGFKDIDFNERLDFDEIEVLPFTDIYKVASSLEIDFEDLQYLNPEIQRWYTPSKQNYKLKIPKDLAPNWIACCSNNLANYKANEFMPYTVRGKRTKLADVARKFKIKKKYLSVLKDINQNSKLNRLKRKQIVFLPFKANQNLKDNMYADLYERPRRSVRRRRNYRKRIRLALRRGTRIRRPSSYYTVRRGDSLWSVARKNHISLDSLIASNIRIIKRRQIRAGDKLVVR